MLNKVMLIGNLGSDPEVRYTADGVPVANFNLATNKRWKDKNTGEDKEDTQWHRIVAWRGQAENVEKYCHKGSKVYIEGELRTRDWEDQEGNKRYVTEVQAFQVRFLDKAEGGGGGGGSKPPPPDDDDLPF